MAFPPVGQAFNIFARKKTFYDEVISTVSGRKSVAIEADRQVKVVEYPSTPEEIGLVPEGVDTSEAVTIISRVELFIRSEFSDRQTYYRRVDGRIFMAAAKSPYSGPGFQVYVFSSWHDRSR